ncbi:10136_t:CDS:2 [Gigaspora rosea]|nr:10136_t:CDS:2 [Gigaspora rosea]
MSEDFEVGGVGAAANQVSSAISAFAAFLPWNLEEKSLSEDVIKMTEFLKTIEGGVTDANNQLKESHEAICHVNAGVEKVQEDTDEIKIKLNAIFEEVIEIKKKVYKREISLGAPHIDMNLLKEVNERLSSLSSTESRKIFKRLFNGIEVACKRITVPNDDEKWKMTKNPWAHEPPERPSINVFNYELNRLSELIFAAENPNHNDAVYEDVTDDEGCPTVAVINGNPSALFNYGDLFLNGKLGIKKDEEKGIRYLKMAAVKGQPKALEELKKRKIGL